MVNSTNQILQINSLDLKAIINGFVSEINSLKCQLENREVEYLTTNEAYKFLKIGKTKFNELKTSKKFPILNEGGSTTFEKQDLIDYRNSIKRFYGEGAEC